MKATIVNTVTVKTTVDVKDKLNIRPDAVFAEHIKKALGATDVQVAKTEVFFDNPSDPVPIIVIPDVDSQY